LFQPSACSVMEAFAQVVCDQHGGAGHENGMQRFGIRRLEQGTEGSDGPARLLTVRMPLQIARGRGLFVGNRTGDEKGNYAAVCAS